MAVGFQRKNVGVLMDLPQAGGGTSAYRDFVENPITEAMSAPSSAPLEGEVLPPEGAAAPQGDTAKAEAAAAALIAAAEKQRQSAGSPLNRVLSGVGGVIGAPFAFLDAALNGGDMTQVTAPFRPQQNADLRFQQTVMGIQDSLAKIRENDAQMRASNASAVRAGLQTNREEEQAAYNTLGQTASGMLYMDPNARRQQLPALVNLARRYGDRYPAIADAVQEVINGGYNDAALIGAASNSADEGARARVNEYLFGSKQTSLGDGLGVTTYSRPGQAPSVFGPGTSVSGLPAITSGPAPTGGSAIDFGKMNDEQLNAFIAAQGGQ